MVDIRTIPFTYPWILKSALGKGKLSILDIGCGTGDLMSMLSRGEKWTITGIDLYRQSIKEAKTTNIYEKLYVGDILKLPKQITNRKYDVVFSSQVVEHLKKKDALRLIKQMEKLAKKRIVITTTVGFMEFVPLEEAHGGKKDKNPHQKHLSGWDPQEFRVMGYNAHGQGFFLIYKEGFLAHLLPKEFFPILWLVSLFFAPLVYFFPSIGTYQVNYKQLQ